MGRPKVTSPPAVRSATVDQIVVSVGPYMFRIRARVTDRISAKSEGGSASPPTIIVCTCTAAIILVTGAPESGLTGIELTQNALSRVMGPVGGFIIFLTMLLFGYTTLLADIYIGETNIEWFLPNNKKAILVYRLLICVLIVVGALAPVTDLWELVDFSVAFMVFFNVIALVVLSNKVVRALKNYERQRKEGVEEPVWDFEKAPEEQ